MLTKASFTERRLLLLENMKLINYSSTSEFNKNLKKLHCCSQDCLSMKARKMGCKSLKGKDTQRGLKYIFF
ncbi:hypothetical protein ATZ36_11005 [Candidatus Endomicrobiellum trichonymphae]|uniref:Uncharacterized protein n=1 Tax=Endomicrobium trichonymphae TaxID=1408204 RepID=A0A1E5IFL5_ENDTX|nr:hypothetical protein ATZ36_11005 [Candidatus Endomicrobium trichonymphae]